MKKYELHYVDGEMFYNSKAIKTMGNDIRKGLTREALKQVKGDKDKEEMLKLADRAIKDFLIILEYKIEELESEYPIVAISN